MSQQNHERLLAAATALRQAREQRQTIGKVSERYGIKGLDEAYAVAQINTEFRVKHGARIIGKKIGLTSDAVQAQLGVVQPDFGILFGNILTKPVLIVLNSFNPKLKQRLLLFWDKIYLKS